MAKGEGSKNPSILQMSFMDVPHLCVIDEQAIQGLSYEIPKSIADAAGG